MAGHPGFIVPLKTVLTTAVRDTFDADYPREQFRGLHVSIEFPDDEQHYPGIWVDFSPQGELERAGIGHTEYSVSPTGAGRAFSRWRFQGYASYTVAAMTSWERDLLMDLVIAMVAFGSETDQTSEFRTQIETNDLIAMNIDFDQVQVTGWASTPGTPWGTDEIIYEGTVQLEVIGEFVSDQTTGTLIPISQVNIVGVREGEPDPWNAVL